MFTRRIARDTATQVNSDKIGVQIKLAPVPEPPVEAITVDYTLTLCRVMNGIQMDENTYYNLIEFNNCIYSCTFNTYDGKYECVLVDELEGYSAEYNTIYVNYNPDSYDDFGVPKILSGSPVYILDDGNFTEVGSVQTNIQAFNGSMFLGGVSLLRQVTENRWDGPDGGIYDVIMSNRYGIMYFVAHNTTDVALIEVGTSEIMHQTFEGVKFNKNGSENGRTKWTYTWEDEDENSSPIWPNVNVNFDVYTDSDTPEVGDEVYVSDFQFTVSDVFPQAFGARPTMDYFDAECSYTNYVVEKANDYDKDYLAQIEWTTDDGEGNDVQNVMDIITVYQGFDEEYNGVTYRVFGVIDVENNSGPAWMWGPYYENNDSLYILHSEYDEQNPGQEVYTAVYAGSLTQAFSIEGNFRKTYNDPTVVCEVENASYVYNFINWGTNTMLVIDGTDVHNSSNIGIVTGWDDVYTNGEYVLAQNQSWNGMVEWWPVGITTVFDLDNSLYAPVWTNSSDIWVGRDYISDDDPDAPEWLCGTFAIQRKGLLGYYNEVNSIKWSYPDAPSPYIPPEPETYNCTVSYSVTGEGFTDHPTALTDENNVIVNIPKYVYLKFSQEVDITEE